MTTAPSNQLFGHEQTVDLLKDAILGSRSMPTWIFGGPFGVGKFTAAHLLAGLLLDPETRPEDVRAFRPRQDTPSGRLHAAGTHPDLHVVCKEQALESPDQQVRDRKQRSIPVAVLRQQIIGGAIEGHTFDAPAYMKPSRGTGKVFIIDEAELIESRGQNLLLKTLEEPPPRTWFILVSTRPDRLLPTIRSRCQPAAFSPLAPEAMGLWRAHAELDTDPDELDWAIDVGNRGLKKDPKASYLWDTLAEIHFKKGDTGAAVEAIKKAIAVDPKDPYYKDQLKKFGQ